MSPSYNKSFNEDFCQELEYTLCAVFPNSDDEELKRFWCDGVSWAPFVNAIGNTDYLSIVKVLERKYIETSASLGVSGQDRYKMKILLGEKTLKKYKNGESLLDCIPPVEDEDWVLVDIEDQVIEIRLL